MAMFEEASNIIGKDGPPQQEPDTDIKLEGAPPQGKPMPLIAKAVQV